MPARDIVRKFSLAPEDLDRETQQLFARVPQESIQKRIQDSVREFKTDAIIKARVLSVRPN
ncbi:MAG TPA: hypothetical protein VKE69_06850, partial [Planctomycetota bacterium]|nr:hypothetical protein [Planctomycetota bacterium]